MSIEYVVEILIYTKQRLNKYIRFIYSFDVVNIILL